MPDGELVVEIDSRLSERAGHLVMQGQCGLQDLRAKFLHIIPPAVRHLVWYLLVKLVKMTGNKLLQQVLVFCQEPRQFMPSKQG